MDSTLTLEEFLSIQNQLKSISDTWADLLSLLHLSQVSTGLIVNLIYPDVSGETLVLKAAGRLVQRRVLMSGGVKLVMRRRRRKYPDDVYIFQNHSNRSKASCRPVTIIAFNRALKKVSAAITDKIVSRKALIWNK